MPLIPCPVCGAELRADGRGRSLRIDCADGHRAGTDPALYEALRLQTIVDAVRDYVGIDEAPEPRCRQGHAWRAMDTPSDLTVVFCLHCFCWAMPT